MTPHPHAEFLHALADGREDEFECQHDQTALELCEICGWKTLIPGEGCLNCQRKAVQPAWHDAPNAPGDWVIVGKGFKSELQTGITQQEIDRVSSWPGRWFGPLPEDTK